MLPKSSGLLISFAIKKPQKTEFHRGHVSAYLAVPTPTWGASSSELQRKKPELKMPNEGPGGGETSGPVQLSRVVNSKCCALLSHSNQGFECGEGLKLGTGVQRSRSAVKSTGSSICVQTISKVLV